MAVETQWTTAAEEERYLAAAREIILLKEQKSRLEKREGELKKELMEILSRVGEPYGPEGQHRAIELPKAVRGIIRLVRQAKVSNGVDETKAEAVARSKGLYERLFVMRPVLDQGAVMVAVEQGLITDQELEEIFPRKTIYSFVPEKEKK